MEEGEHFYLILPTTESLPVRSVGVSADHKLSLPDEELVGPRSRITCQKSLRKLGPKQQAELSSGDIQVS